LINIGLGNIVAVNRVIALHENVYPFPDKVGMGVCLKTPSSDSSRQGRGEPKPNFVNSYSR